MVSGHRRDEPFADRGFAEQLFHKIEISGVPLARWNHDRIVDSMTKVLSPPHKPVPNEIRPNVAFSLLTTVQDYSTFPTRVTASRQDAFDLKPMTRSAMMKSFSHINSALSWGLVWGVEEEDGSQYLWQWGDNGGWKNIVIVHPESRSALVVFSAATGREHPLFLWV